ncbi:hypothetical protein TNCV_2606371 [Trichonephila clavipes]|nr:hypothetical protein TNCV_2606371 [Trichonephila clavipes]
MLAKNFKKYFLDEDSLVANYEWIRDLYQDTPEGLSTSEEEIFIDFTSSEKLKGNFRKISENESDDGELSCSNLDSDDDIKLSERDYEESEECADIFDNIPVNPDIYNTRDGAGLILHDINVSGRIATRNVLRLNKNELHSTKDDPMRENGDNGTNYVVICDSESDESFLKHDTDDLSMWPTRKAVAELRLTTRHDCLLKQLHIAQAPFCTLRDFREDMNIDHIRHSPALKDFFLCDLYWQARDLLGS